MADESLARTPLYDLHLRLGAKMVPFAGYAMPVQYPPASSPSISIPARRRRCSTSRTWARCGSTAPTPRATLEALVPGDIAGLAPGRMRYTLFTNERGGILDDLMVTNRGDHLFLVVNAARKDDGHRPSRAAARRPRDADCADDRALLALQGPGGRRGAGAARAGASARSPS